MTSTPRVNRHGHTIPPDRIRNPGDDPVLGPPLTMPQMAAWLWTSRKALDVNFQRGNLGDLPIYYLAPGDTMVAYREDFLAWGKHTGRLADDPRPTYDGRPYVIATEYAHDPDTGRRVKKPADPDQWPFVMTRKREAALDADERARYRGVRVYVRKDATGRFRPVKENGHLVPVRSDPKRRRLPGR